MNSFSIEDAYIVYIIVSVTLSRGMIIKLQVLKVGSYMHASMDFTQIETRHHATCTPS